MVFPVDSVVDVYRAIRCLISEGADWDWSSGLGPVAGVHELGQVTECLAGAVEALVPATCVRGKYYRDPAFWALSLIFNVNFLRSFDPITPEPATLVAVLLVAVIRRLNRNHERPQGPIRQPRTVYHNDRC